MASGWLPRAANDRPRCPPCRAAVVRHAEGTHAADVASTPRARSLARVRPHLVSWERRGACLLRARPCAPRSAAPPAARASACCPSRPPAAAPAVRRRGSSRSALTRRSATSIARRRGAWRRSGATARAADAAPPGAATVQPAACHPAPRAPRPPGRTALAAGPSRAAPGRRCGP